MFRPLDLSFFTSFVALISFALGTPLPSEPCPILRVGTTLDYKPFSYREEDKNTGFDVEVASLLAKKLGAKVVLIQTSWPTLMSDLLSGKYDIAMSGVTQTEERKRVAIFTPPYLEIGKSPLVRKEDRERFSSFEAINKKGTIIGVNPGGTNERFVRKTCPEAETLVIENNLSIPQQIIDKKADVMITDNIEAVISAREYPELCAVNPETPFTKNHLAYMMRKDDKAWLKKVTQALSLVQESPAYKELYEKYLKF